jgi:hypothetical protein
MRERRGGHLKTAEFRTKAVNRGHKRREEILCSTIPQMEHNKKHHKGVVFLLFTAQRGGGRTEHVPNATMGRRWEGGHK